MSENLHAVEELEGAEGPLDVVFVESGGDNLTATFSPALADVQVFVLDCAGGDDVPRKGRPGVASADLLVVNKTDIAPFVGSDVALMLSNSAAARDGRPVLAVSLRSDTDVARLAGWVLEGLAAYRAGTLVAQDPARWRPTRTPDTGPSTITTVEVRAERAGECTPRGRCTWRSGRRRPRRTARRARGSSAGAMRSSGPGVGPRALGA